MREAMWMLTLVDASWMTDKYVYTRLARYRPGDVIYSPKSRRIFTPCVEIANELAQELCDTPFELTMREIEFAIPDVAAELARYDAETDRIATLEAMPQPEHLS